MKCALLFSPDRTARCLNAQRSAWNARLGRFVAWVAFPALRIGTIRAPLTTLIVLSMAISVYVSIQDHATSVLTALEGAMTPRALAANIGEAEVKLFQRHLLNNPPNKQGWPSTGFWPAAARAVNYQATDAGPLININQQGVRQRLLGGMVRPVNKKFLAIPARAEAYGRAPSEFNNLKVAFGRGGAFALVEAAASQITYGKKKKNGQRDFSVTQVGGGVFYWLVKFAEQHPDPTVIPDERDVIQVAGETMDRIVKRVGGEA